MLKLSNEGERRALAGASKNVDLMAEHSVFDEQLAPRAERVNDHAREFGLGADLRGDSFDHI